MLRVLTLGGAVWVLRAGTAESAAIAQTPASVTAPATATISGLVQDPSGAVIQGAAVHLSGKGSVQDVRTDETGRFALHAPPGTYNIQVQFDGFAAYTSRALPLKPGPPLTLTVHLAIATRNERIDVNTGPGASTETNGAGFVFSGDKLNLLSDDPTTLRQQLNALAGPGLGGLGPQILVNGFSGGQLPPKASIRSISINQNPYSAYYDSPGFGRIEVETKPGADKFHGGLDFAGTDQPLDARNPYDFGIQPPFSQFQTDGNLNGPLGKKTSFFLSEATQQIGNNAVVNAVVLDPALQPAALSEAVPAPQVNQVYALRVDRQFTANNFGFVREEWSRTHILNAGIGSPTASPSATIANAVPQFVLPSAAFTSDALTDTLQAADTQLLGPHAVNEVRFQYLRSRLTQDPNSTAPALAVQGAFIGGGSLAQVLHDNQDHYEGQDRFEFDRGHHAVRLGFRLRAVREANESTANFNGAYTFNSISAFQITEQGLAAGLTPTQLRAAGGGAAQFDLTTGQPGARLLDEDLGVYAEDDWTLSPRLTFSYGLRFESQSAVPDHTDPAPRLGLTWAIPHGKSPVPLLTLRAGYGIFYDRFPAANLLQAVRQNGVAEVAYFVQNPDFYPAIPPPGALTATEPTLFRVNPDLHTSYNQTASIGADRAIGRIGTISDTFLFAHGAHEYLTRNVNAPLPGTYDPSNPASGTRPLGTSQNLYQYSSDSNENDELFFVVTQLQPTRNLFFFTNYLLQQQANETSGSSSFPSNQYNLRADYARATGIYKQTLNTGLFWNLRWGFGSAVGLNAHSGAPFDITTGTDLNGDTIFNDRPVFATDLTRSSVVRTRFGNFDTDPLPGQQTIPRNFGNAPANFWLDLQLNKDFHLGPRPRAVETRAAAGQPAPAAGKPTRPWDLKFEVEAENLLNHNNPALPVGVLSSPYFGRSLSLASDFSPLTASNRTILLHSFFSF